MTPPLENVRIASGPPASGVDTSAHTPSPSFSTRPHGSIETLRPPDGPAKSDATDGGAMALQMPRLRHARAGAPDEVSAGCQHRYPCTHAADRSRKAS